MGCRASKGHDEERYHSEQIEKQLKYGQATQRKETKILMLGEWQAKEHSSSPSPSH
jgi:hypothetical protein